MLREAGFAELSEVGAKCPCMTLFPVICMMLHDLSKSTVTVRKGRWLYSIQTEQCAGRVLGAV